MATRTAIALSSTILLLCCNISPIHSQSATVTAYCDNWGEILHSTGGSFTLDAERKGEAGSWATAITATIGVSSSTIIRVKCIDAAHTGGFIAQVTYLGQDYYSTNPLTAGYWRVTSAEIAGTSPLYYYAKGSGPWGGCCSLMNANAYWVWNGQGGDTMTFDVDMGLIIATTTTTTTTTTKRPTAQPTEAPTRSPSDPPTTAPSERPSVSPSDPPTFPPSQSPSKMPNVQPTVSPTEPPTPAPSGQPTVSPTVYPSKTPTKAPTELPTITEAEGEVQVHTTEGSDDDDVDENEDDEGMVSETVPLWQNISAQIILLTIAVLICFCMALLGALFRKRVTQKRVLQQQEARMVEFTQHKMKTNAAATSAFANHGETDKVQAPGGALFVAVGNASAVNQANNDFAHILQGVEQNQMRPPLPPQQNQMRPPLPPQPEVNQMDTVGANEYDEDEDYYYDDTNAYEDTGETDEHDSMYNDVDDDNANAVTAGY